MATVLVRIPSKARDAWPISSCAVDSIGGVTGVTDCVRSPFAMASSALRRSVTQRLPSISAARRARRAGG